MIQINIPLVRGIACRLSGVDAPARDRGSRKVSGEATRWSGTFILSVT